MNASCATLVPLSSHIGLFLMGLDLALFPATNASESDDSEALMAGVWEGGGADAPLSKSSALSTPPCWASHRRYPCKLLLLNLPSPEVSTTFIAPIYSEMIFIG